MLHEVMPHILMRLRMQPLGEKNLRKMQCVSRALSKMGKETGQQYDAQCRSFRAGLHHLVTSNRDSDTKTLISLQNDLVYESDLQLELLNVITMAITARHGEKWHQVTTREPRTECCQLHCVALEGALGGGQLTFTSDELRGFELYQLDQGHFVQVDGKSFQPDLSATDPYCMAAVEVLHDIVLSVMYWNNRNPAVVMECLFVLRCLHRSPWKNAFPADKYDVCAIAALKLVALAMLQFPPVADVQLAACMACAQICENLGAGATRKLIKNGGMDAMPPVLRAMRAFPKNFILQNTCVKMIVMDARKPLPGYELRPERIKYRNSVFVGIDQAIIKFACKAMEPYYAACACQALRALFVTKLGMMTDMESYVLYCIWCVETWVDMVQSHSDVRDAALITMAVCIQAKDNPRFDADSKAKHRHLVQELLNRYEVHVVGGRTVDSPHGQWIGTRVLGYCCAYATGSVIRENRESLCSSLRFLTELCQDNNTSRDRFIYESNGVSTCMTLAHEFSTQGSRSAICSLCDMDIVEYAVAVLEAVYVTENRAVVAGVPAMFVATASSPSFTVSSLHDIAQQRYATAITSCEGRRLLPADGNTTVIQFLQEMMNMSIASSYLVHTCLRIIVFVCNLPENKRLVDTATVQAVAARFPEDPTIPANSPIQNMAKDILRTCGESAPMRTPPPHSSGI